MSNEICLNPAFADCDSIEDVLNQEYTKGYEKGRADAEKRYQLEYDRQIDNEQEAFENGYDKGYQQGRRKELKICVWSKEHNMEALNLDLDLDTPMHFTPVQKAWIKKYIAINGERQRIDAIEEYKRKLIEDVSQRAQANERVYSVEGANLFNYATRTFIDALNYFAEQLKEKNNG